MEHGWRVINADKTAPPHYIANSSVHGHQQVSYVHVDLTDMGQVMELFTGMDWKYSGTVDAVVHLAAMRGAGSRPSAVMMHHNTASTYNVLEACSRLHIYNVVLASSETLFGCPFVPGDNEPAYFPLDEALASAPSKSGYGLSKLVGEVIAEQYCRWDAAQKIISLRFSNVMDADDYQFFAAFQSDLKARAWNAWGYVDARDAAQACRLALEAYSTGAHVYNIASADTVVSVPSADLVHAVFPSVPYRPQSSSSSPYASLISIEKARRELKYKPQFSWQSGFVPGIVSR